MGVKVQCLSQAQEQMNQSPKISVGNECFVSESWTQVSSRHAIGILYKAIYNPKQLTLNLTYQIGSSLFGALLQMDRIGSWLNTIVTTHFRIRCNYRISKSPLSIFHELQKKTNFAVFGEPKRIQVEEIAFALEPVRYRRDSIHIDNAQYKVFTKEPGSPCRIS